MRRLRNAEGARNSERLRRLAICDRAADGAVARRRHGPDLDRLPQGFSSRTAPASCISMPMAPMASPIRRISRRTASRCSIAALPAPSRISAAATISAITGISTASSKAHQHLQRFRRRHALPDRSGLCESRSRHRSRRLSGRRIDGRDRQSGPSLLAPLQRMCRSSMC